MSILRSKLARTSVFNGATVWSGASRINSEPIVLVVTGLYTPSHNPKTGVMCQTWVLNQQVHPFEAIHNGKDQSVCGECPMRKQEDGKRLCYVNPMTLGQVYNSYQKGRYPQASFTDCYSTLLHRPLRIGSYGDPAAVPIKIWTDWVDLLKERKIGWTGYTRQWLNPENDPLKRILMASVFTEQEQNLAQQMGWRTYRIVEKTASPVAGSILCPGSFEAGYAKTCEKCLLCNGASSTPSIFTYVHGNHSNAFIESEHSLAIYHD